MKRIRTLMFFAVLVLSMLIVQGCGKDADDSNEKLYTLLGKDKEELQSMIDPDDGWSSTVMESQETYSAVSGVGNSKLEELVFYNDVFGGYTFYFDSIENAYDFAKEQRNGLESEFGEKTTYPGVETDNKDYFDNIANASQLKEQYIYYEDWTETVDDENREQINKMLGNRAYSRIDVRLELYVLTKNEASVSVKYKALPALP